VSDEITWACKFGGFTEVMESSTVTSFPSDMEETGNRAGKGARDLDGFRPASHSYWATLRKPAGLAVAMIVWQKAPTGRQPTTHEEPGLLTHETTRTVEPLKPQAKQDPGQVALAGGMRVGMSCNSRKLRSGPLGSAWDWEP
jgi:hypothetical protein